MVSYLNNPHWFRYSTLHGCLSRLNLYYRFFESKRPKVIRIELLKLQFLSAFQVHITHGRNSFQHTHTHSNAQAPPFKMLLSKHYCRESSNCFISAIFRRWSLRKLNHKDHYKEQQHHESSFTSTISTNTFLSFHISWFSLTCFKFMFDDPLSQAQLCIRPKMGLKFIYGASCSYRKAHRFQIIFSLKSLHFNSTTASALIKQYRTMEEDSKNFYVQEPFASKGGLTLDE